LYFSSGGPGFARRGRFRVACAGRNPGAGGVAPGRELVAEHVAERHRLTTWRLLADEMAVVPTKSVFGDVLELGRLLHRNAATLLLLRREQELH